MDLDVVDLLKQYAAVQPKRATGGIYALAGFDYQLRLYVAELSQALSSGAPPHEAGHAFVEALSDVAVYSEGLICIQAKRSLTLATLAHAAEEVSAIEAFLASSQRRDRYKVRYRLVASQGDPTIQWSRLPLLHPARSIVDDLIASKRLEQPSIEADPGWRAVAAVWPHLREPFAFVRFALDRASSRQPDAADAKRIRDDICERYASDRRRSPVPGQLLTLQDFEPTRYPSSQLDIGREVTLARIRDQQYMERHDRRDAIHQTISSRHAVTSMQPEAAAHICWITGRSGVGKSVLLVQCLERLVAEGHRVLWLGSAPELLEDALRAIAAASQEMSPQFIAVDDLYDRDARSRINLSRLGAFIDEAGRRQWPLILTCGPSEFADAFEEDSRYRGFEVHRTVVSPVGANEADQLAAWYHKRTGRNPAYGSAFDQARKHEGALFVSLAIELAHGDLREFAARFARRLDLAGLRAALQVPLAFNRLYLRVPYSWFNLADRESLATLNTEGDFQLLEVDLLGRVVRLTHPHIADALYRALRRPANAQAYANDLVEGFERAMVDGQTALLTQLLRLFSGPRVGVIGERLAIIDENALALGCSRAWRRTYSGALDADAIADLATSWACWAQRQPVVRSELGEDLLNAAVHALDGAHRLWTHCWDRLRKAYPTSRELFSWAESRLGDPQRMAHPYWSLTWESCLTQAGATEPWRQLGIQWLQLHAHRPDWHYVWKKFLPQHVIEWDSTVVLKLGERRLTAEHFGADWAFVLQDLLKLAQGNTAKTTELARIGVAWLESREDREDWSYVWRALIDCDDDVLGVPRAELIRKGWNWLSGREDRPQWPHVWTALFERTTALPQDIHASELVRLGRQWLSGREDRTEWSYVWQSLMQRPALLTGDISVEGLTEVAIEWMRGRDDHPSWSFLCRALLESTSRRGPPERRLVLIASATSWLRAREERTDWGPFWVYVVLQAGFHRDTLAELLHYGYSWLQRHRDADKWGLVWQSLVHHRAELSTEIADSVLQLGWDWLRHSPGKDVCQVWWELIRQPQYVSEHNTMLQAFGASWLEEHGVAANSPESSRFVEGLLDLGCHTQNFLSAADSWLELAVDKPSWPVIAAKYVAYFPGTSMSAALADVLQARIQAVPNRRNWTKIETILRSRLPNDTPSPTLRRLLDALEQRSAAPAWALAEEQMRSGTSCEGRVIAAESDFAAVELTIGLIATWVYDEGSPLPVVGTTNKFHFCAIHRRGFVYVGLKPFSEAPAGNVRGVIRAHTENSFSISVEQYIGRLHRTMCIDFNELVAKHPNGSRIDVVVLSSTLKGLVFGEPGAIPLERKSPTVAAGDEVIGTVLNVVDYGVFVDIDGTASLLHHTQMINGEGFKEQFSNGDRIHAFVKKVDGHRVELTERDPHTLPSAAWRNAELQPGETLKGVIKNITDFGLFVAVGDVTGLLHCSRLSRKADFRSTYKKGDPIVVRVSRVDGMRVSFSLDQTNSRSATIKPIKKIHKVGDELVGRVSGTSDFGVFFNLSPGTALLHKSQLPGRRFSPEQFSPGDSLLVRIIAIEGKRISLALAEPMATRRRHSN